MTESHAFVYAEVPDLGLTRGQLRGSRFEHPTHAVYATHGSTGELTGACAALLLILPSDAVFTHATAARLRGWWLPDQLDDVPVIACTNAGAPHHNRRGVYVRRCRTSEADRTTYHGLPVTTAERTLIELAEDLSLLDLVCTMDSALGAGHCTTESLAAAAPKRRRGSARFAEALALADARSESRWESVLRLLHVWGGFHVQSQYPVHRDEGALLARADLWLVGTRRLPEYDGADHRDAARHVSDLSRDKVLIRDGWQRFGYTATEIHHQPERIIRDACEAAGRPFRSAYLTQWLHEYRLSTLTAAGRAGLADRMQRFQRPVSPRRNRPRPAA